MPLIAIGNVYTVPCRKCGKPTINFIDRTCDKCWKKERRSV